MLEEYKICSQCGIEKIIDDFPVDNKAPTGRRANCRDCKNAASKKTYEETRDDAESVARRIIKKCKEREKERLVKFIKRRDCLDYFPEVELTESHFDIDYSWVLAQRDLQNNKCYYTDIDMVWSTGLIDTIKRMNPSAVTVERLDSNRPYVKDNCVLACWWANCSKGAGTIEELINFSFDVIKKYTNKKQIDMNYAIRQEKLIKE